MKGLIQRLTGGLAALAVATVMVFATSQALAGHEHCENDGWNVLGACVSEAECEEKCEQVHGENFIDSECTFDGCCWCIL
jgi:hypothetical protein